MGDWKPRRRADVDTAELLLDPAAAVVLQQLDGRRSVEQLCRAVGLERHQVERILDELVGMGAVAPAARVAESCGGDVDGDGQRSSTRAKRAVDGDGDGGEMADDPSEQNRAAEDGQDAEAESATHRKLYESEIKKLERDVRVRLAERASDPVLSALCFDPDPAVIQAVLQNHSVGMAQARLIAANHHHAVGLDALARRAQFLRDGAVGRLLLRNQQTPDAVFRRLFAPLPLVQQFKATLGREATERAKRLAREALRQKFQRADGEETAGLIYQTEGRCLGQLIGLHIDQKATTLLCRRTYQSALLIQALARFPGTPPKLLEHLLRQPLVQRQPQLRNLIRRHPNCPAALKR